jgi:hypothetical protein
MFHAKPKILLFFAAGLLASLTPDAFPLNLVVAYARVFFFFKKNQVTAPGVLPNYTEFPFMLFRAPQNLSLNFKEQMNYIPRVIFVNSFSET